MSLTKAPFFAAVATQGRQSSLSFLSRGPNRMQRKSQFYSRLIRVPPPCDQRRPRATTPVFNALISCSRSQALNKLKDPSIHTE